MTSIYEECKHCIDAAVSNLTIPNLGLAKTMLNFKQHEQDSHKASIVREQQRALTTGQQSAIQIFMRHNKALGDFQPVQHFKQAIKQLANTQGKQS